VGLAADERIDWWLGRTRDHPAGRPAGHLGGRECVSRVHVNVDIDYRGGDSMHDDQSPAGYTRHTHRCKPEVGAHDPAAVLTAPRRLRRAASDWNRGQRWSAHGGRGTRGWLDWLTDRQAGRRRTSRCDARPIRAQWFMYQSIPTCPVLSILYAGAPTGGAALVTDC